LIDHHTASNITRAKDWTTAAHPRASEVGQLAATFNEMLDRPKALYCPKRLVADVSYQLRTPRPLCRAISICQRVLRSNGAKPLTEVSAILPEILNEVEDETKRMQHDCDLLLLAQADSGVSQLKMEAVELDTLLLMSSAESQSCRAPKGLAHLTCASGTKIRRWCGAIRTVAPGVGQFTHAIKYTPSGGTITLSLENQKNWVKVTVADTGIGIKAEDREMIFERFYRTDKARSREMGGSGLGLSIARWIAQAHNGKITVESTVGVGSTFTLWLPEYVEAATATPDLQPVADQ
jgi:signal transduction histidine kinase